MTAFNPHLTDIVGVALPAGLLALGAVAIGLQLPALPISFSTATIAAAETVTLPPGEVAYRQQGQYYLDGKAIDAPMTVALIEAPLTIMKYQVTEADYAACVADGACEKAEPTNSATGNVPVTGVSYRDAAAYAAWYSTQTGQSWALPTDRQWAYAAGSRFNDDALGSQEDEENPALRWLATYRKEAERQNAADPVPQISGSFGENEHGIADMAGNVWEWTDTCHRSVHLDKQGAVLSDVSACTIRVLEGKHRLSASFFIRDARSGGCSVGVPPDNLGFRLVREPGWHERLLARVGL